IGERSRVVCVGAQRSPITSRGYWSYQEIDLIAYVNKSRPASTPPRLWPAFPQPYDPVHILRFAAEVPESRHKLSAVVLGVHCCLNQGLGDADNTRGFRKPGDSHLVRQRGRVD